MNHAAIADPSGRPLSGNQPSGDDVRTFTIDTVAPINASAPSLNPASDRGISNSDGITNVTKPQFDGTGEPGSIVTIFSAWLPVASGACDASGAYHITISTALANGTHSITAKAVDLAGNSSAMSGAANVTIDSAVLLATIAPVTPSPRRTPVSSIAITFTRAVYGFNYGYNLGGLVLKRDGGANLLTKSQTFTTTDNITWTLGNLEGITGTSGTYPLVLSKSASGITDVAGNSLAANAWSQWVFAPAPITMDGDVTVNGTAGDDAFALSTDGSHLYLGVTLAGQSIAYYTYLAHGPATNKVIVNGMGGKDKITIDGGPANESVAVRGASATFTGSTTTGPYQVVATDIDEIRVTAGPGTGQIASMYDSTGATDTFTSHAGYAEMSGTGYYDKVTGFAVTAYSSGDAGDVAKFYDSPGADIFTARPRLAQMEYPGYATHAAQGFRNQYAYSTAGGTDEAHFYDSKAVDTFTVSVYGASMTGPGTSPDFSNRAFGFAKSFGHSTAGGSDVSNLFDSWGNDTYKSWANGDAFMDTPTYDAWSYGFASSYGRCTAGGSNDVAYLYDSSGNDVFVAKAYGQYACTYWWGNWRMASGFDKVYFVSENGGTDEVFLFDASGSDEFYGSGSIARLSGTALFYRTMVSYFYEAQGFDRVTVLGTSGGTNHRTMVLPLDYALAFYGTWTGDPWP